MADYNNDQYGSWEDNKHRPGWSSNVPAADDGERSYAPVEGQMRTRRTKVNLSTNIKNYAPNKTGVQAILISLETLDEDRLDSGFVRCVIFNICT